jgi:hypothetical protein
VVNQNIKKDDSKVVDTFDLEDIGDKKVFCRCWRSASVSNSLWIKLIYLI